MKEIFNINIIDREYPYSLYPRERNNPPSLHEVTEGVSLLGSIVSPFVLIDGIARGDILITSVGAVLSAVNGVATVANFSRSRTEAREMGKQRAIAQETILGNTS